MTSIIAKALEAREAQQKTEEEAQQQERLAQAAARTRLLDRIGPFYTERLSLVLDDELPPLNWAPGKASITFVDRGGNLEASVSQLEAELFGVGIVVTVDGTEQSPCTFAVKRTSKADDNGPLEFSNLAEFGAAVSAHYPQIAAEHAAS